MASPLLERRSPQAVILSVRGQRVILDADLAALYGVPTKRLNEQVKRNHARFPEDFAFRLSSGEVSRLNRSQFATGSQKHRDPRFPPLAFTEHGALMAANVLNSQRAIAMSVEVVRAFVRFRRMSLTVEALARRIAVLESRYDKQFAVIFKAIRQLMVPPAPPRKRIAGFGSPNP
jgi:hypothetical protein